MRPLRILLNRLESIDSNKEWDWKNITTAEDEQIKCARIENKDVEAAIESTRSSSNSKFNDKYQQWKHEFASV